MFSIFPLLSSFLNLINIPNQGGIHLASTNLFRTFPVTSTPVTKFLYHISHNLLLFTKASSFNFQEKQYIDKM